jgi:hypothetical protein
MLTGLWFNSQPYRQRATGRVAYTAAAQAHHRRTGNLRP